jgi:hypothetical protein
MSETSLVPVNLSQLPITQIGTDEQFMELAKSSEFLARLQLYTKGKAINKGLIKPGNYGIPINEDELVDLGSVVDLLPFARRPKAIDLTDIEAIITSYDPDNEEFKRIASASLEKESHCMYGPSFLVIEKKEGRFLEFFCGTKSMRNEAKKIYPFCPLSDADIERQRSAGNDVSDLEAHGPLAMTLKSRLVEKGAYSWHVPVVSKCSTPWLKLPAEDKIVAEIGRFLACKGDEVEIVKEPEGKKRRAR